MTALQPTTTTETSAGFAHPAHADRARAGDASMRTVAAIGAGSGRRFGIRSAMIVCLSLAGALSAGTALAQERPREPTILVSGDGRAALAPDMAIVSFGVVTQAKTAREALDQNNVSMRGVLDALKGSGIAERDMQTAGFSINPQYRYPQDNNGQGTPELIGYQVANTLTIRLRDVTKVGTVIDQAVSLGINQGGSIQFVNEKPEAALKDARKAAVADAMDKARTLAEAAGVTLGKVIEISESSPRPEPMPMMRMAKDMAAEAMPIASGENNYAVTVNLTFAIAP